MVDSVHHLSSSWDSPDAKNVDFIYPHLAALFANSYADSAKLELMDPQISPTYGNLVGLPPVLVDVGECEMLRGAAEQLYVLMRTPLLILLIWLHLMMVILFRYHRLKRDGNDVRLNVAVDMPHAYLLFEAAASDECTALGDTFRKIAEFLEEVIPGDVPPVLIAHRCKGSLGEESGSPGEGDLTELVPAVCDDLVYVTPRHSVPVADELIECGQNENPFM